MATNPNMKAIQTVTVGATGATSITFNNIPQTYTDLVIMLSTRETLALGNTYYTDTYITINGQTSASGKVIYSNDGSTINSYPPSSAPVQANGGNSTASIFSNVYIYIPNYTSTAVKSISADSVTENNSTNSILTLNAFNITNGAAINTITISATTGLGSTFVQHSSATLYGITKFAEDSPKAVGGAVTSDASYWYHTFKSSGNFIPSQSLTGDVLVIAGGGSGASSLSVGCGAGGGAGGLVYSSGQSFANGTSYTVAIGAGGSYGNPDGGNNGTNSNVTGGALSLTAAVGGGKGGDYSGAGSNGGSGGGAGQNATTGGSPTSGQGNAGGSPANVTVSGLCGSGGGGSASAGTVPTQVGGTGNYVNPGNGGAGTSAYSSWGSATGTGQNVGGTYYYAGGGGGAPHGSQSTDTSYGVGGYGGGGAAAWTNTAVAPFTVGVSGTLGTGGGGGGGCGNNGFSGFAGNGGSGLVIIRYAK